MPLSLQTIRQNIRKWWIKYHNGEVPKKVYRSRRNRCAGCLVLQKRGILSCCKPPLCAGCHKVHNGVESVLPDAEKKAARLAKHNERRHLKRKGLDAEGTPMPPRVTRTRTQNTSNVIGVVALFCAASMLGSQFVGPRYHHLFGVDINEDYGRSFSLNNGHAPLLPLDILELSVEEFMKLLEQHAHSKMEHCLFLITLDCSRASRANRHVTAKEKREFYVPAIEKMKLFIEAARLHYNIFLLWEFVNDKFVLKLIEEEFPEMKSWTCDGHCYESRRRVFFVSGFDPDMKMVKEELKLAIEREGGGKKYCAADAFKKCGLKIPRGTRMFGAWTKKEYRRDPSKGTDPWEKRTPTICSGGIWLVFPNGREAWVSVEILRWIRTRGGDVDFKFSPGDGETLRRLILAMGVSTVIGSAARRALERWIEEYGLP